MPNWHLQLKLHWVLWSEIKHFVFQDTQKTPLFPFNNANNFPLLSNVKYTLAWKGEHTDSSRQRLNNRTVRTTVLNIREIQRSKVASGTD